MTQHDAHAATGRAEPMSGTIGDPEEIKRKFWKELAAHPVVMIARTEGGHHAEPMRPVLDKDAHGHFWFYTSKDNRIADGGAAMAQFVSKGHELFACIKGTLTPETDPAIIDKYWSKPIEAWYAEGRNDPNLLMLRFELDDAEVWVSDVGVKGMFKLLTGRTMKAGDAGEHAELKL